MPIPLPPQRAAMVRSLLRARGLSLAEACRRSRSLFEANPYLWLSPGLYDELRHPFFSPSLQQLYALSVVTDYRLADWLQLFGFSFDAPALLQSSWPTPQTCELDGFTYDTQAEVTWFEERGPIALGSGIEPLSRWLSGKSSRTIDSLANAAQSRFRYFKIGRTDAYAYPELLPESVIRVDPRISIADALESRHSPRIFAIEHDRGIVCGQLKSGSNGRVILCPTMLPYPPMEIKLGREAQLLGGVDLEFRSLVNLAHPVVAPKTARFRTPAPLVPIAGVGQYFQRARMHAGLSLQEASDRTKHVAHLLRDKRYFCVPSALSDMEARKLLPRHIHKLIAVSAAYCLPLNDLLSSVGMPLAKTGREAMSAMRHATSETTADIAPAEQAGFLGILEERFEAIPFFFRHAYRTLTGKKNASALDLFWAGATNEWVHPYLKNAVVLVVNRRSKTPAPLLDRPVWAQPLYLLELREGSYLCAPCTLQDDTLLIRPCTASGQKIVRMKNHENAEVVGKIVALARVLH